jgi:hypothetical protein
MTNISDINSDHSQVLQIDCDAPMTTEQTTERITTYDALINSSNIDTTTTVTTTNVKHQSITTTTDTTTGKSLVTSALIHDMLKLK